MSDTGTKTYMQVILSLVILISTLLNTSLIYFTLKNNKALQTMRFKDKLIISLAVCDILRALVGYALELRVAKLERDNSHEVCNLPGVVISSLSYIAIHHLVLMTFDRWLFITKPMKAILFHSSNVATMLSLIVTWAIPLLLALLPLFGFGSYSFENDSIRCSVNWPKSDLKNRTYQLLLFTCFFFLPLAAMIFFYVILRRFLRKSCRILVGVCEDLTMTTVIKTRAKAERRTTSMFFVMALVFVISWSPYGVLSCINAFSDIRSNTKSIIEILAVIPAKASTLYNPVVIAWYDRQFLLFLLEIIKAKVVPCRKTNAVVPTQDTFCITSM